MGVLCVVYGCSIRSNNKEGISTHIFPKEPAHIRQAWVNFVKTTRKDFVQPKDYQRICGKHFTSDAFADEYTASLRAEIGFCPKRKLKEDAVPTLTTVTETCEQALRKQNAAVKILETADDKEINRRKRRRKREVVKSIQEIKRTRQNDGDPEPSQDDNAAGDEEWLDAEDHQESSSAVSEPTPTTSSIPILVDKAIQCSDKAVKHQKIMARPYVCSKDVELVYSYKIAEQDRDRKTSVKIEIDIAEEPPFLHMKQQQHLHALTREGANTEHTAIIQEGQTSETHTVPGSHSDVQVKQEVCTEDAASRQMRKTEKQTLYTGNTDAWIKQESSMGDGANTQKGQTFKTHAVSESHSDIQIKQEVSMDDESIIQKGHMVKTHTVSGSQSDIQIKQEVSMDDESIIQKGQTFKTHAVSGSHSDIQIKQEVSMDDESIIQKGQTFKTHAVSGSHSDIQIKQEVSMDDESIIQKGQTFKTHTVSGCQSDIQIKQEVNTENTNT